MLKLRGTYPRLREISISSKFVTCGLFSLLILTGPTAHAQSVPEAMADVATVTEAAAATTASSDTWEGKVSYLASKFTGRKTANGERFNPNAMTMAHKTLPFGTMVRVTNLRNGKSVRVRVNDRGPFTAGRVADLSLAAARQIDMLRAGVAHARLEALSRYD
ncbi:septal ring lytic transglycosylase RlpA family protein [Rhodoferax sp.]|uniref:septal ring lytic transglycosylase RlpA family protein n=1 Tax=Rhodoferax sp. TaxID=50421 RepID=UPI0025D296CE|nr:septal ring lytic transglycosylase RlpA family protein [Rhodoferax sp.]